MAVTGQKVKMFKDNLKFCKVLHVYMHISQFK